jgi:putative nucleotidyltransferase with HDIG domain
LDKITTQLSKAFKLIRHKDLFDVNALHYAAMEFIASSYRNPAVVLSKIRVAYFKDYQLGHALRCAAYFSAMLRYLKWPADVAQNWVMGALLHDVGKLVMSESIQNPNLPDIPLKQKVKDEFTKQEHVANGIEIAEYIGSLTEESVEVISLHHERLDGSGYPTGQKLTDLNDAIRIFCVIDEFDRLTRMGDKGKPIGVLQAFRKMLKEEHLFDSGMLQRFIKCIGVYPPGTMVKLKSGKVGIMLDNNGSSVHPNVKVIYNSKLNHHVSPKMVDLSTTPNDDIEGLFYGNKIGIYANNYL